MKVFIPETNYTGYSFANLINDHIEISNDINEYYDVAFLEVSSCDDIDEDACCRLYTINHLKGNPIVFFISGESARNGFHMNHNKIRNIDISYVSYSKYYTISSLFNSNYNCFFPYIGFCNLSHALNKRKHNIKCEKYNFCNIITSDCSVERSFYINTISQYKKVDSFGRAYHNTPNEYYDDNELSKILPSYKFSLVVENEHSFDDELYLTEKIVRAIHYGTVPIYWGSKNVRKIINEDAIINITDMNYEDAISLIKKYDNDIDLYNKKLNTEHILNVQLDYFWDNAKKFINDKIKNDIKYQKVKYRIFTNIDHNLLDNLLINDKFYFEYVDGIEHADVYISENIINENMYSCPIICIPMKFENFDYKEIKNGIFYISSHRNKLHNLYIDDNFWNYSREQFNKYMFTQSIGQFVKKFIKRNNYTDYNFDFYEYYRNVIVNFIYAVINNKMTISNYDNSQI